MNEDDPRAPPKNTDNIDLSQLSPQELKLYRLYGKLPSRNEVLSAKLQEKKYFDSGDYALNKAGRKVMASPVGFRHPNAERMARMSRNSISSAQGILINGKSNLEKEATGATETAQEE